MQTPSYTRHFVTAGGELPEKAGLTEGELAGRWLVMSYRRRHRSRPPGTARSPAGRYEPRCRRATRPDVALDAGHRGRIEDVVPVVRLGDLQSGAAGLPPLPSRRPPDEASIGSVARPRSARRSGWGGRRSYPATWPTARSGESQPRFCCVNCGCGVLGQGSRRAGRRCGRGGLARSTQPTTASGSAKVPGRSSGMSSAGSVLVVREIANPRWRRSCSQTCGGGAQHHGAGAAA